VAEDAGDWVWLARIRRPQGRKGEVFADILSDFPQKFTERRQLWLLAASMPAHSGPSSAHAALREIELTDHWLHKGGIVLHFSGIDSISAAEALKGLIVAIPRAERAALTEDEIYISDLVGCTLLDVSKLPSSRNAAGEAQPFLVGEIVDVDRNAGPVPLLVVRGAAGEILIPFAKSYLRKIDLKSKRVEMALPEGLVDLNAASDA
jgi:16S rRNA processing protein RimM